MSLTFTDTARWHLTANDAAYAETITSVEITASITGTASVACTLTVRRQLAGTIANTGSVTAALTTHDRLVASVTGTASVTATLTTRRHIAATITGTSAIACTLTTSNPLHVVPFTFLIAPDGPATAGMRSGNPLIAPYPGTVTKVILSANEEDMPQGADFIVAIEIAGDEIGTTPQRPKLLDSATVVDGAVMTITSTFDNADFLTGDRVDFLVIQPGTTYAGRRVTCQVITLEDVS